MGNINRLNRVSRGDGTGLSTPYGKHKLVGLQTASWGGGLSTPYGKHKLVSSAFRAKYQGDFLLPMGNINSDASDATAGRLGLSTPYGKHKPFRLCRWDADRALSTPYGKHKPESGNCG